MAIIVAGALIVHHLIEDIQNLLQSHPVSIPCQDMEESTGVCGRFYLSRDLVELFCQFGPLSGLGLMRRVFGEL